MYGRLGRRCVQSSIQLRIAMAGILESEGLDCGGACGA